MQKSKRQRVKFKWVEDEEEEEKEKVKKKKEYSAQKKSVMLLTKDSKLITGGRHFIS